ncbi:MAG: hypothetical protein JW741_17400 [Sedimentisphaerales bacterium]|nr:hypothetical protein [Sedimentisphaerales bacterium]
MLTLIKRELYDQIAYVVLTSLMSLIVIGIMIYTVMLDIPDASFAFGAFTMQGLLMLFCFLGAAQMYSDRANRVSPLLATLAVTRSRILAARVAAGALLVLSALIPVAVVAIVLVHLFAPPLAFHARMIVEISTTVALLGFASYCVGLYMGWTSNKILLVAGCVLLLALIMPVFLIKGFGAEAIVILLLLIGALLVRTWTNYTTAAL